MTDLRTCMIITLKKVRKEDQTVHVTHLARSSGGTTSFKRCGNNSSEQSGRGQRNSSISPDYIGVTRRKSGKITVKRGLVFPKSPANSDV